MTDHSETSGITEALAAAGREMSAALAEAGYRIVATAALGQVAGNLPDAARGIVEAMPRDQAIMLAEHTYALHCLAATATMTEASAEDLGPMSDAALFLHAHQGRDLLVARKLDERPIADLIALRRTVVKLLAMLDEHVLPQDQS